MPIYQMSVKSDIGLCTSGPNPDTCVNGQTFDEFTTRISVVFERVLPPHIDAEGNAQEGVFYTPPQEETFDYPYTEIKMYSKRGQELTCWVRADPNDQGGDDRRHHPDDIDFCDNMADWVPTWYVGDDGRSHAPSYVNAGTWPNEIPITFAWRDAVAMAADCRAIINSPYVEESIAQPKLLVIPNGPEMGGPCWNDPDYDYGLVCAAGGVKGTHLNDLYRNMDGTFMEFCPSDFEGKCPRYYSFNCPAGSGKSFSGTSKGDF